MTPIRELATSPEIKMANSLKRSNREYVVAVMWSIPISGYSRIFMIPRRTLLADIEEATPGLKE